MRSKAEPPAVGSGPRRGLDPLVAVIVCFGAVFVLSQFFRASNAVIAKTLSAEFGLSPEALGLLTGMFFFAFGAAQIPLGIVFDRFGARRTVPVVLTAAIAGSILYGLADGEAMLIAGRVLLGVGCSGVLMGSLFLFGQWAPAASFSTWMGRMIAIGGAGGLLSTSPLAAIAETLGWRVAFWGAAGLTAAGAIAIYALARDRPSSERGGAIPAEGLRESLSGVRAALATPGFPTLTLMGFASYPVVITVAGPLGRPLSRGPSRPWSDRCRQRPAGHGGRVDRHQSRAWGRSNAGSIRVRGSFLAALPLWPERLRRSPRCRTSRPGRWSSSWP